MKWIRFFLIFVILLSGCGVKNSYETHTLIQGKWVSLLYEKDSNHLYEKAQKNTNITGYFLTKVKSDGKEKQAIFIALGTEFAYKEIEMNEIKDEDLTTKIQLQTNKEKRIEKNPVLCILLDKAREQVEIQDPNGKILSKIKMPRMHTTYDEIIIKKENEIQKKIENKETILYLEEFLKKAETIDNIAVIKSKKEHVRISFIKDKKIKKELKITFQEDGTTLFENERNKEEIHRFGKENTKILQALIK